MAIVKAGPEISGALGETIYRRPLHLFIYTFIDIYIYI
jgi:hypothetical protein